MESEEQTKRRARAGAQAGEAQDPGEPVFLVAGGEASGEFYCAECGYGISVRTVLPDCPMCRGTAWEEPATSPYGRSRG